MPAALRPVARDACLPGACACQVIEAAIEAGVDDVEVVDGDHEGTTWVLTEPKDLSLLAGASC